MRELYLETKTLVLSIKCKGETNRSRYTQEKHTTRNNVYFEKLRETHLVEIMCTLEM